jgi:hypothetical protein
MIYCIIDNIKVPPDYTDLTIINYLKEKFGFSAKLDFKIVRRSLDSRKKSDIHYNIKIIAGLTRTDFDKIKIGQDIQLYNEQQTSGRQFNISSLKIIITGGGPAGLFCALRLIEYGASVLIIERGKSVDERLTDILAFEKNGDLNPESNVVFGEGGAGLYSDGKLTARTRTPQSQWLFEQLIQYGADEKIKYDSKPHLGSDKIRTIVKNLRKHIEASGSKIIYNEKIDSIHLKDNKVLSIKSESNAEYDGDLFVLATGHSAADTYSVMSSSGIQLEKKDFAVGVRVEHPADLINEIQYGKSVYRDILPAAEYFLKHNNSKTGRGVYSFCMCPGGMVINSSSETGRLCVNGMSYSKRSGLLSNSAIVVTVSKNDFDDSPLSGIAFQRKIEADCFSAGDSSYFAPAQTLTDFVSGKKKTSIHKTTFLPGVVPCDVGKLLPEFIYNELKNAVAEFEKKMKGFLTSEAIVIAPETRTSSPVRISRNENMTAVSAENLYPVGEGSGYSGGIVSSAVDGIRAADFIAERYSKK